MPRPRWTTPAQDKWLETHLAGFTEAQRENRTAEWFPPLYTEWFDLFPLEPPSAAEIQASTSAEAAATKLRQKKKEVSNI